MRRLVILSLVFFICSVAVADWDSVAQYSQFQGQDGWTYLSKAWDLIEEEYGPWENMFWDPNGPGDDGVWQKNYAPNGWIDQGRDYLKEQEGMAIHTMRVWTSPYDLGPTQVAVFYDSTDYEGGGIATAHHAIEHYDSSLALAGDPNHSTFLYESFDDEVKTVNIIVELNAGDELRLKLGNTGEGASVKSIFTMHIADPRLAQSCQDVIDYGWNLPGDISGPAGTADKQRRCNDATGTQRKPHQGPTVGTGQSQG